MVNICIDRRLLGTSENLIVDDGLFSWSLAVPPSAWHLSGAPKLSSQRCLDTALQISGISVRTEPPERFVKALSLMSGSLSGVCIPWQKVLPTHAHKNFTKNLVDASVEAMVRCPLDYCASTWVPGNAVLEALQPAAVDRAAWQALIDAGEGNVPAIRSFEPGIDGFAPGVVYNRFKTLTGRLTVEKGPQILTLKREHRKVLRSAFGNDGVIVALDFAALEARVLLYEHGRRCDEIDLYGMISSELGYARKAVKGAVISELYGSSKHALGKVLGIRGKELNVFVKQIREYFRTDELLERVKKQFVTTGRVINRYGRPVMIDEPLDNIFISYYAQSTGVDVTMLGFKQVIDQLSRRAPRVRPIFVLHDALIIDAHRDDLGEVAGIKHVKVKGYVQRFPLRYERVN